MLHPNSCRLGRLLSVWFLGIKRFYVLKSNAITHQLFNDIVQQTNSPMKFSGTIGVAEATDKQTWTNGVMVT